MEYKEILEQARKNLGPYCKGCSVCSGTACRNTIPGPGAKGIGDTAVRNYQKWQEVRVVMDTIHENHPVDSSAELFGRKFSAPFFAGPVGAVKLHYSDVYTEEEYNNILVSACAKAGIAAFTGDGTNPQIMVEATKAVANQGGVGVPTVKPWNIGTLQEKLELVKQSGAFAVAMDIDASGLPFLKNMTPPAGSKSVEELKAVVEAAAGIPLILKGIMSVKGALKAKAAGAAAIVVSNHGGRVLDQCPSTAEVLPEIAEAVGKDMTILVDGGIRSGVDIFKALAMGANGVLIARPFVTAVYGGGADGVEVCIKKLKEELCDTMAMCGAGSIAEISRDMIRK